LAQAVSIEHLLVSSLHISLEFPLIAHLLQYHAGPWAHRLDSQAD